MKPRSSFKIHLIQPYNYISILNCFSICLFCCFIFISCSNKNIDHQKFIDAYIELRITQDTLKSGNANFQDLKKAILKKHGLTEKQYDKTFNYFNENPERWNDFYEKIIARVDTLRKNLKQ